MSSWLAEIFIFRSLARRRRYRTEDGRHLRSQVRGLHVVIGLGSKLHFVASRLDQQRTQWAERPQRYNLEFHHPRLA